MATVLPHNEVMGIGTDGRHGEDGNDDVDALEAVEEEEEEEEELRTKTKDTEQHHTSHPLDYRDRPISDCSHMVGHNNDQERLQLQQRMIKVGFGADVRLGSGIGCGDVGGDLNDDGGSDDGEGDNTGGNRWSIGSAAVATTVTRPPQPFNPRLSLVVATESELRS